MHDGQEGQEPFSVFVDLPVEQGGQQHGMAEAGDRKELGNPLDNGENDGLQAGHGAPPVRLGMAPGLAAFAPPVSDGCGPRRLGVRPDCRD